jgi:FixJ family two-component response regulator
MLTPKQEEIARLVARGWTHKRIARETGLAVQTVKEHVRCAAERIPGEGPPKYKLIVFVLRSEWDGEVA